MRTWMPLGRGRVAALTCWIAVAILAVLTAFSFFVADAVQYKPAFFRSYDASFSYGLMELNISQISGEPRLWWRRTPLKRWYRSPQFVGVERDLRFLGLGYVKTATSTIICIPVWLPIGLLLIQPVWREVRLWRARRRTGQDLCRRCGYDVRATPSRCPECGTEANGGTD